MGGAVEPHVLQFCRLELGEALDNLVEFLEECDELQVAVRCRLRAPFCHLILKLFFFFDHQEPLNHYFVSTNLDLVEALEVLDDLLLKVELDL